MRGRPKSLKPLLTGPIERVLRQVAAEDPAAAGLLALWWADQYHALVDVLDATDADNNATPEALADALEAAETLGPPAGLDERWRVFLPLLRGEAQDMIDAAIRPTLAARRRQQAKRARELAEDADALAAGLHDHADDLEDAAADAEAEEACHACHRDKRDKRDKRDSGDKRDARSSSPPNPSSKTPKTSKKQAINVRAHARDAPASSSAWMNPYNLDGRDPVDLALEFTGERRDDARARACWGAHLRRLGPRAFCAALHTFEVDAQTNRLENPAAALNTYLGRLDR